MVSAVLGVVGAVVGSKASSKASKSARAGQQEAQGISTAAANQARGNVNDLFGQARDTRAGAFSGAADFLGSNVGTQLQPFIQGNVGAQQQTQRGLDQTLNAILGQPIDLSGFQARQIGQPSDFNIQSPFPQQQEQSVPSSTVPQLSGFQLSPEQQASIDRSLGNVGFGGSFGGLRLGSNVQNFQG